MLQPGSMAAASATGKKAAMKPPMNGTKRMRPATIPQSTALGMPMSQRHVPITMPKPRLSSVCIRKKRLSRAAASSSAAVVRCRSAVPARRRKRSRMSSRWSSRNRRNRITRAGCGQRRKQRLQQAGDGFESPRLGLPHFDRQRVSASAFAGGIPGDFLLKIAQRSRSPVEHARCQWRGAQCPDLVAKCRLVLGQVLGQLSDLHDDRRTQHADQRQGADDTEHDRRRPPEAPRSATGGSRGRG